VNQLTLEKNRLFYYLENIKSENLGFSFSFLLHSLLLFLAIGLPNFFDSKPISIPTIIPIEIINLSEVTSISTKIKEKKPAEIQQQEVKEKIFNSSNIQEIKKVKEKKFNSSDIQEIKKVDIKEKPKININKIEKKATPKQDIVIKEKIEVPIKPEKEKIKIDSNQVESLPTKKIKPKLKPKPNPIIEKPEKKLDVAVKTKLKPKPNPIIKKPQKQQDVIVRPKPKPMQDPEFSIASMLKDLRYEQTTQKNQNIIEKKELQITENYNEESSNENAQLSISEIDLLRQQLSSCWNAPAGALIEKGMVVKISAKLKQNRRVLENSVRIVDTNISKSNSFYGPITESAMRTLLNPECIPLKLPEDKYQLWKSLTITFDYSIMKGY